MADFDSSLPVRTENAGDVIAKIADATTPSQQLKVNVDGSINITDNSGSITVDAVNLDIRDLVFATDKVDASGSVVALDAPTLAALESITVQNPSGAGAVNIQDGGNSITVDGSVTVSSTNLDIRDLVFATDKVDVSGSTVDLSAGSLAALESITVQNGAGAAAVNIQDGGNSITVDGTIAATQSGTWTVGLSEDHNYGSIGANSLRVASQIGNATGAADFNAGATGAQTLRVEANISASSLSALESITVQNPSGAGAVNIQDGGNSITVDAVDLDIRDLSHSQDSIKIGDGTDFLAVNTDGSINVVISNDVSGNEVCAYNTSASLAAGASINFDYTVTAAMTLIIEQAWMSGSGKIKAELKVETAPASGTYNTKFVGFNSTADANVQMEVSRYLKQVAGAKVRITITNRDNQPQDVYSTLTGSES